jgi:phenylacetate-CoA ligase
MKKIERNNLRNLHRTKKYKNINFKLSEGSTLTSTKDDLRRDFSSYLVEYGGFNFLSRILVSASTSGTSGEPLRLQRNLYDLSLEEAFQRVWRGNIGWKLLDRAVVLRGDYPQEFQQGEVALKVFGTPRLYLNTYALKSENVQEYYDQIVKYRPKILYCYPTIAVSLAKLIENAKLPLISIPIIVFSSEYLEQEDRQLLIRIFNSQVFGWYGNGERTVAAGQCLKGNYHFFWSYSLLRLSESKEIFSTPLPFSAFKVINYATGDFVNQFNKDPCDCGNPDQYATEILGRNDEFLYHSDGTKLPIYHTHIFRDEPTVLESKILQNEDGTIEIEISPLNQPTDVIERIRSKIHSRLPEFEITIHATKMVQRSKSGKLRIVETRFGNKSNLESK